MPKRTTLTPEDWPHPAQHLLQITFTVEQYQVLVTKQIAHKWRRRASSDPDLTAYWDSLPGYLLARCPLCGHELRRRLDTHSLVSQWFTSPYQVDTPFAETRLAADQKCPHFVACVKFINLRGHDPTGVPSLHIAFDVPFVMPVFLADPNVVGPGQTATSGHVVLHSLPICRIEHDQFVPRHAVYFLTYYATDPKEVWRRRWANPYSGSRQSSFLPLPHLRATNLFPVAFHAA